MRAGAAWPFPWPMQADIPLLLELQAHDSRLETIRQQIAQLPHDLAALDGEVKEAQAALEAEKQALRALETARARLDGEIKDLENKIFKYKVQQATARKAEEFAALEHEMATAQAGIGEREDQGLAILMEIDEKRAALVQSEQRTAANVAALRARAATLKERGAELAAAKGGAEAALAAAERAVPEPALKLYQHVRSRVKRGPWVVVQHDQKCGGCHMRVSNETSENVRRLPALQRCDHCTRILYLG